MGEPTDHTLRVQQLFVRHQSRLRAFVLALWPRFAAADDVLQEVFLTVTAKAAEFEEGSNFLAWAREIAKRKVLEARRRASTAGPADDVLESLAAACPDDWADDSRIEILARCLKGLAPKAREIVQLRYLHEHSPPEIARRLARSVNSIAVALSKARAALRECVERRLAWGESR